MQANSTSLRLNRWLVAALLSLALLPAAFAATIIWSGAGGNDNWSTAGNWTGGTAVSTNSLIFTNTDATATSGPLGTPNNIVDTSTTIQSLRFNHTNGFHTTQIPSGSVLTLSASASPILLTGTGTDAGNAQQVYATMLGNGALYVTNGSGIMAVYQGSATSGGTRRATLDLEGLDTFTAYLSQFSVCGGDAFQRSQGTLKLARTNALFCFSAVGTPGVLIGQQSGNGGAADIQLGITNGIFSDAGVTAGGRKYNGTLKFNPAFTNLNPTALFRNRAGTGRQELWIIGDQSLQTSSSGTSSTGTMDYTGGTVDALVNRVIMGRSGAAAAAGPGTGTLTFSAGTINVNSMDVGVQSTNGASAGTGTVNVNGSAVLVVNSAVGLGLIADGTATGTLNINGGTAQVNAITNGGGTTSLSMNGGVLILTNNAGTAAAPLGAVNLTNATLRLHVANGVTNLFATTLTTGSTTNNTVDIVSLPSIFGYPTTFPLISYGFLNNYDFALGTLPGGYTGYLSNNIFGTIELVLTGGPAPLKELTWNGNINGDWNTATANWRDTNLVAATYGAGDFVTFNDSASGVTTVNLTTALAPGSLLVSNITKAYTFNGSGSLTGAVSLVKSGSGTLTLANSSPNTFSGGVNIQEGTLLLSGSADRLPTNTVVTLDDVASAQLNLNNLDQTLNSINGGGTAGGNISLGSGNLTVASGGGFAGVISGTGRLIKTNYSTGGFLTLSNANTYSGGTVIGGFTGATTLVLANATGSGTGPGFVNVLTNGSLYLGNGGVGGSVAAGTITNNGLVRLNRSDDLVFANTLVGLGSLQFQNSNTVVINGINSHSGGSTINLGTIRIGNAGALGSGIVTVANGSPAVLQLSNNVNLANALIIANKPSASGAVPNIENISGTNTLSGPMQLTQNGAIGWFFDATAGRLVVASTMIPPTSTSQNAQRNLILRGDALGEWTGGIIDPVGGTTNLALRKLGLGTWKLAGTNTYTGPTAISNGTLVVNGLITAGSVTAEGGTLAGLGTITVPVTVNAAGTLAPGDGGIGTLTISNTLTLGGSNIMEVATGSTCDKVRGLTSVTFGGALTIVTNGPLSGGEVFQLFSASSYSGTFSSVTLPPLASPLGWDDSLLLTAGTLSVTGAVAPPLPIPLNVVRAGDVLTFSWTNAAFRLQSQTNTRAVGYTTNWFNYPGGNTSPVLVTNNPANPTVFFRLISP